MIVRVLEGSLKHPVLAPECLNSLKGERVCDSIFERRLKTQGWRQSSYRPTVRADIREVTGSRYRGKHRKDGGQASIRRRVGSDAAAGVGDRWSKDTAHDE